MRTVLLRATTALALSVGLIGGPVLTQTAEAKTSVVATQTVNVRSGPSETSKIVGGIDRGQSVTVLSTISTGWSRIKFAGVDTAYVKTSYLQGSLPAPTSTPPAQPSTGNAAGSGTTGSSDAVKASSSGTTKPQVTTTDVNLRKGPGSSYEVITIVAAGTTVNPTGKVSKDYAEVQVKGKTGYLSTLYLVDAKSSTTGSKLPAVVGTRAAAATLHLRKTSDPKAEVVATIKKGGTVSITGKAENGRAQIVYQAAVRWVNAKNLTEPKTTEPTSPGLPKVTGTRYATTALDIRSNNTDNYTKITEVPAGTALSITGVEANGRAQIVFNSAVRWVTAKYLTKTAPTGGSGSSGSGTPSSSVEKGLKPNAIKTYRAAIKKFPEIKTVYGVRQDSLPDHPSGRALDLMIPDYKSAAGKKLGGEVAAWAKANAKDLGINYVIWNQHIWNITRDKEGWRFMADRGSDTANHKNHVHITVFADGLAPR